MAGDNDRTCLDFCSRTCPERHSEEELHSNEEGCGGLPHLGGDSQPGQDHDDHDDHDDGDHDDVVVVVDDDDETYHYYYYY